jgi:hypothetical protein
MLAPSDLNPTQSCTIVEGKVMFRLITLSIIVLGVAGCAAGSLTPGTLPKGATSGVYTIADPQTVAACIATAVGSTVEPVGDRLIVTSARHPGLSYSVGPNAGESVYPTQVAVKGREADPEEEKRVNVCVVSQAG